MSSQTAMVAVKDPEKINPLPSFNPDVVIREILPALNQPGVSPDQLLIETTLPIEGMLIGVAMEFLGLDNPTIEEFRYMLEKYLQQSNNTIAA